MSEIDKIRAKEIASRYQEAAVDISNMIAKISEWKTTFESLSAETNDNADPEYYCSNVLEKLGELLASVVIYSSEYLADANKTIADVDKIDEDTK